MNLPESFLLGIQYGLAASQLDSLSGPYTIRQNNRFFTGNIFLGKVVGTRGWNIPVNGTDLKQGAASGWETDRLGPAVFGEAVAVIAEDETVYPGKVGAQMGYYEKSLKNFVLSVGSLRFGGSLIVDGDLQTIVSNALADLRPRVVSRHGLGVVGVPALAFHDEHIFLAWTDINDGHLNMKASADAVTFSKTYTSTETSQAPPAPTSHNGRLYVAWTGVGDGYLNVAKVSVFASTAGAFGVDGIEENVTLADSSEAAPALCSHAGRLFIAWQGKGDGYLNIMFSDDNGATFHGKHVSAETASGTPALVTHNSELFIAWPGPGGGRLNIAKVDLIGSTTGSFAIEGIVDKVTLGDRTFDYPALASLGGVLYMAWTAAVLPGDSLFNEHLNVLISTDGKSILSRLADDVSPADLAPALVVAGDKVYMAWASASTLDITIGTVRI
jgi:hypothetical protein